MNGSWILRPKLYRMLHAIGHRVAYADSVDKLDDWIMRRLEWVKRQARQSGWSEDAIDEAVMDGLVSGRAAAHEHHLTCDRPLQ